MQRMASYHRAADSTVHTVTQAYDKGLQDIDAEVERIFGKYAKDGGLSIDEAVKLLNEPISRAEWDRIKAKISQIKDPAIKRQLLNQLNAPAYAARITRMQALKANTYVQTKIIADAEIAASTGCYIGTINDAYYRTMFDVQRGLGVGFEFAGMPTRTIETILKRPWSGEHYSKRVWGNTDALAGQLNDVLTGGFMSGLSTRKMSQQLQERMEVGKHAANRLIRTETTYMANAAELESYQEAEIDQYQFLATLDARTSPECREHDLKVYDTKDAVPGKNMPPLHPYCRSTTRAYFGQDTYEGIDRRARDPVTGESQLVLADTSYSDWRQGLDVRHGADQVATIEKQIQNKVADKQQYDRYKKLLGSDAPKSFAAFQDLKYTGSEEWSQLKGDYRKLNAYEKIIVNEPKITTDLQEISKATGAELVGLDYRLKSKDSYLRKVNSDSKNSLDTKIISDTIAGTNDVIRYTYQTAGDKLAESFNAVTGEMEAKGYSQFKLKNTWNDKRNPYKGINGIFISPDGQKFEVQFHTPESFELKNGPLHKLYEEFRLDSTTPERRLEISKEMFVMSAKLSKPKDIDKIK